MAESMKTQILGFNEIYKGIAPIAKKYGIERICLFRSVARGDYVEEEYTDESFAGEVSHDKRLVF